MVPPTACGVRVARSSSLIQVCAHRGLGARSQPDLYGHALGSEKQDVGSRAVGCGSQNTRGAHLSGPVVPRANVGKTELPVDLRVHHLPLGPAMATTCRPAQRRLLHDTARQVPGQTCRRRPLPVTAPPAPRRVQNQGLLTARSTQRVRRKGCRELEREKVGVGNGSRGEGEGGRSASPASRDMTTALVRSIRLYTYISE